MSLKSQVLFRLFTGAFVKNLGYWGLQWDVGHSDSLRIEVSRMVTLPLLKSSLVFVLRFAKLVVKALDQ